MICKFFGNKKGTGGGTASIDYLLNERTEQGTARVLKGDETLTREIINSLNFKHKACVGCLSFSEKDISDEDKQAIIESFETALLTPEMKDRVNILWVEHTDKGRLELNFVIPKVDLETKKSFNPYYYKNKNDFNRIDTFEDLTNAIYGFTNPKDPAKEQSIKGINPKSFKDHKALDNHFKELAIMGRIENRDQLISYIENELKDIVEVEITRKGKDYLSLKLPNEKKATRYKGELYQNGGNYADTFREENARIQKRAREFIRSRDEENIERLELKLIELIDKKSEFNRKRYQVRANANIEEYPKRSLDTTLATDTNNFSAIDNNQRNSVSLASEANANTERLDQRWRYNSDPTEQDRNKSDRSSDISNDNKGLNDEFTRTAFDRLAERKRRLAERKSKLERTIREQTQLRNSYFQKLTFERIQASFNKFNDRIQRIKERFTKQQHTRALLREFDDRIREIGAKIEQKLKDKSKIAKRDSQKPQKQFYR